MVLDSKGEVVKDFWNRGTANRYTYLGDNDPDKNKHSIDVKNWVMWGTGIDDKSNVYERIRILGLGGFVSKNYGSITRWAKNKNITLIGETEILQFLSDKGQQSMIKQWKQDLQNLKDQYDNLLKFNPEAIVPQITDFRR